MPELFGLVGGHAPLELQTRLPARLAKVHGQGIQAREEAFGTALEITVECQIVDLDRLALGVGALELRRIQTQCGALQGALAPVQPELAARLDLGEIPLLGQALRQPFRPVALRQAQVGVRLAVLPLAGANTRTQTHGHRLAVGQGQAGVESLAGGTGCQTQADVSQGQRWLIQWLQGDLAVEH
ncbi:hypothetical protein D3C87_1583680 [compost metagenome]